MERRRRGRGAWGERDRQGEEEEEEEVERREEEGEEEEGEEEEEEEEEEGAFFQDEGPQSIGGRVWHVVKEVVCGPVEWLVNGWEDMVYVVWPSSSSSSGQWNGSWQPVGWREGLGIGVGLGLLGLQVCVLNRLGAHSHRGEESDFHSFLMIQPSTIAVVLVLISLVNGYAFATARRSYQLFNRHRYGVALGGRGGGGGDPMNLSGSPNMKPVVLERVECVPNHRYEALLQQNWLHWFVSLFLGGSTSEVVRRDIGAVFAEELHIWEPRVFNRWLFVFFSPLQAAFPFVCGPFMVEGSFPLVIGVFTVLCTGMLYILCELYEGMARDRHILFGELYSVLNSNINQNYSLRPHVSTSQTLFARHHTSSSSSTPATHLSASTSPRLLATGTGTGFGTTYSTPRTVPRPRATPGAPGTASGGNSNSNSATMTPRRRLRLDTLRQVS
eukprot:Nk52_evm3s306 gene=Nk52_evmTU3s306